MKLKSGEIYHVYSRGNNRQRIFYERENYYLFLKKIKTYLSPHCDLLSYCLMPNHFHLLVHANRFSLKMYRRSLIKGDRLVTPKPKMNMFSKGLQLLLSSYTKTINKRYTRSGSLFRQNTKCRKTSDPVGSADYSLACFSYIHQNPVTAGLVMTPEEWSFSSYRVYANLSPDDGICNIALAKKILCLDENVVFNQSIHEMPTDVLKKIFQ